MYLERKIETGAARPSGSLMEDVKQNSYEQYKKDGGIINETDYTNALARAKDIKIVDTHRLAQAQIMARVAGIVLQSSSTEIDPRVALYAVLRGDTNPGERYHHSQMTDQHLFAEALRMLGDSESLRKFIARHPHIFKEGK